MSKSDPEANSVCSSTRLGRIADAVFGTSVGPAFVVVFKSYPCPSKLTGGTFRGVSRIRCIPIGLNVLASWIAVTSAWGCLKVESVL